MTTSLPPISDHFDGFGLNDRLTIERDERDPMAGNASHDYKLWLEPEPGGTADRTCVGVVQFQHGPRTEAISTPGALDPALVAVLLDRYRAFQAGPFSCRENAMVITKLEEALLWMHKRALTRTQQGVLGTNMAHRSP